MKKNILLLILSSMFAMNSFSQTGWYLQSGVTESTLTGVYFVNPTTCYITGFGGTIIKTTNAGINWNSLNSGTSTNIFSVMFTNEQTGWCFGGIDANGYILKTNNSGLNWSQNFSTSTYGTFFKGYFLSQNIGYVVTHFGNVFKTTNAGANWNLVCSNLSSSLYQCFFVNENTGWCVGNNGIIIKTTNSGVNWFSQNGNTANGLFGLYFTSINTGFIAGQNGIILKTTNGGQNWVTNPGITTLWLNCVYFIDSCTGWIVGGNTSNTESIILKTENCGINWIVQNSPTNNRLTYIHFANYQNGVAVGVDGTLLRTTTGGSSFVKSISNILPDEYILSQNYPNPFNPTTNIKFNIKYTKMTTLKVYNILGEEVATLVNERLKPGEYEVTFDASALPSGIYFYTLSTDNFKETKKMLMIK